MRARTLRFTRCLFFSRYATARRRILSFIPFSLSLSLIVRCFASSPLPRAARCVCAWRMRARVCAYVARAIGFSRRRSKRSYLTRHFRIGGIATAVCIVAVLFMSGESYAREIKHGVARSLGGHNRRVGDNRFPL